MIGVGQIFEDYKSGRFVDDDEVAVTHGPAELDYPSLSVAMVDIRATLENLRKEALLPNHICDLMIEHQKKVHFSERSYESIQDRYPRYADILKNADKIALKNTDANLLLDWLCGPCSDKAQNSDFEFEDTHHWRALINNIHSQRNSQSVER